MVLLEERVFQPPRAVLVERDGTWWPGRQTRWMRLSEDEQAPYWWAEVRYGVTYEWGTGQHMHCVTPDRVRLPDEQ